ncbi:MAG: SpoIIE family protein phosphatase [Deltaproteobacteria bacterium]|nr:SpoIIE family protein phosphatase [Deltaproteobacteria bacterium]
MGILAPLKFRLQTKIITIVLGLPFLCVILFGTLSYIQMINLGGYAAESIDEIGSNVSDCSKSSLQNHAKKYLMRIISNQAAFSDAVFHKVMQDVNRMTARAEELWNHPSNIRPKHSHSYREKPENIFATSSYKLAPGVSMGRVKRELNLSSQLEHIFMSVFAGNDKLSFVYVGTQSGIIRTYPWVGDYDPSYDPRKRSWYQRAAGTGKLGWSEPYVDAGGKDVMVTCSRPFYNSRGQLIGVVSADVTLKSITEKIINTQVGDLGYVFLIDRKGNVIARPGLETGDVRWDESFEVENFLRSNNPSLKTLAKDMTDGRKGISVCTFGKDEKYVAFAPLIHTKWSVAVVLPIEEVVAPISANAKEIAGITRNIHQEIDYYIKKGQISFILVFFTMIIIIVFFGLRLSKKITRPILTLDEGVKIIGSGNLDHHLEIETGDEIEALAHHFNNMSQNLKDHIAKLDQDITRRERFEQARLIFSGVQDAIVGTYSFDWIIPHMVMEKHEMGSVLFKKGDKSDKLYYIGSGSIHLTEINKSVRAGHILGEMGLFRASKERTLSAVCETDIETYSITHDKLFDLYYQDPSVGFRLIQIITQRLIENLRAETKEKERIESELRIASEIQSLALPSVFPPFPGRKEFDISASMVPAKEVGGDLYDFFFIDDKKLCFLIGDVSGKGVPAALFMMTTKTLLKAEVLRGLPLEQVFFVANNIIAADNKTAMFISLFCAVLDTETGHLEYANAGHNHPLLCRRGKHFEFLRPKANFVLGPFENITFSSEKLTLQPNDVIFLYTDGVTEAMNHEEEFYSEKRLQKALSDLKDMEVAEILAGVSKDLRQFVQFTPQYDDMTMLAVKFNGFFRLHI